MADLTPVILTSLSPLASPAPGHVAYLVDPTLGTSGSKSITMDTLFSIITRNIQDNVVRWQGSASTPGVSAGGGGAIYFDSSGGYNCFKASENGLAYDTLMLVNKAQNGLNKTFTNPILTGPNIDSFVNAQHYHQNAAGGGLIDFAPVTLTDASFIATNAAAGQYFRVTIAGNRTLDIPSNAVDGMTRIWEITQGGSGSNTLALNVTGAGSFAFGTDITSITASTLAGKIDVLTCAYNAAKSRWLVLNFTKGF